EPNYKNHLILLPKQATITDIALLREEALDLEGDGRLEEAKQLMRRVLALDPTNPKVLKVYDRITLKLAQQPVLPSPKTEPINRESAKTITETPKPAPPPEIELKRDKGIDYRKLRDLLKQQQWKEADEETARVMLQAANRTNRTKEGWLRVEDIDNFPCEDLRTIDQLWVKYSGGRFGFSVQGQIYREIGGMEEYNERNWDIFGSLVGWQKNNSWNWQDINYSWQAPQGHLPLIRYGYKGEGSYIIYHLTSRIFVCQTSSHQIINQKQPVATIIQPPVISVPQTPPSIQLKSAKGIDYRKLEDLLKRQQWKKADEETRVVMLQVANRRSEGWLRVEDIDNFSCEDLRTIDQLWVKYSSGRFGFSVQAKIYRELGGTREYNERVWNAFGDRVGWRVNNSWIYRGRDVTFDLKAPHGHLPGVAGGYGLGANLDVSLLSRRDL
ncbi:MAG: GUN4 domain-containing protein, partial [Microcystis sp.]|uniref:GUN4 domain-containing protein n=1 Tax=Microcystis sp. TaxID=1127 RepID=UPI0039191B94